MTLRLPLTSRRHATLISVYVPTMSNQDNIKENLYSDLNSAIIKTPKTDKLIMLGDFNARVGSGWKTWSNILGRHGIGHFNSNGALLLEMGTAHKLTITNTLFQLPHRKKTSWMHPRFKHWHQIDFIIVKQSDRQDDRNDSKGLHTVH
ncbi:craniofacial development protein 2 [Biomphalaria glabrata]